MCAAATIVGARSMLATGWRSRSPAGMPGPRMTSGTRVEGSYGLSLPIGMRCSPCRKPLSDVKTMSVRDSSPFFLSAATIRPTASSTARSDSSRSW